MQQQLQVQALYSDGKSRDVTAWARFDSMDEGVLGVTSTGVTTAVGRGQAPIMVRFEGQAEIATLVIPFADAVDLSGWQNNNFVDELASAKFKELGIVSSGTKRRRSLPAARVFRCDRHAADGRRNHGIFWTRPIRRNEKN